MRHALVTAAIALAPLVAYADPVDDAVRAEMQRRKIPGISIAIVDGGKLVRAVGYGVIEAGGTAPVTATTLFQAGSISKAIAALGTLHLVEHGVLALDADVNTRLVGWKLPDSALTRTNKVTIRRILSHTAGLTVHGFPGYAVGDKRPTIEQILDGQPPANTPAIRVDVAPDSTWRYSGGGYTILQKLIVDVTGKPFPTLMREVVLGPAGMTHSTYEQPLPADLASQTATAHLDDRSVVPGRWHIYPEMAAAGLWTTPTDLALFAIEVQHALAGKSKIISAATANQMLTAIKNGDGLGVFLEGTGKALRFGHDGRDEGFDAMLSAFAKTGQGAVVMINTNDNSRAVRRILDAIAAQYHWPSAATAPALVPITVDPATMERYTGRYERANNQMFTFGVVDSHLFLFSDELPDEELVPVAPGRFQTAGGLEVRFATDPKGAVTGAEWKFADRGGAAPRLGPLIHALAAHKDPDARLTAKLLAALRAFGDGKPAPPDTISPGFARDFGNGYPPVAGTTSLAYIDGWTLPTTIERHDGKVDRVTVYRREPARRLAYVIVYLTADGRMTDFDIVGD